MVAPGIGVMLVASRLIPTRINRGTARSHPRARITGLSQGKKVAVNIAMLFVS